MKRKCSHPEFRAVVSVHRTEHYRFLAHIKIKCAKCGQHFQFYGAAPGMDLNGIRTSADGIELRVAVGTPETLAAYYSSTTGVKVSLDGPEETERKSRDTVVCRDVVENYIKQAKIGANGSVANQRDVRNG